MSSLALLCSALFAYFLLVQRTKDWLAPSALLCLFWFSAASLSDVESLKNPNIQRSWAYETYAAVYLCGVSMFIAGLLQIPSRTVQPIKCNPSAKFRIATTTLMWLSLIAVAARLYVFGFSLDQFNFATDGSDLKDNAIDAIPIVNYFEIMTPFLSLCAIFELSYSNKISALRRTGLITYIVYSVVFYCILLNLSRGSLMVIICGALYLYARGGSLRLARLVMVSFALCAGMIGFSFIRLSSQGMVNSFLGDSFLMNVISPIYTYVAFNFDNLNSLVMANLDKTYFLYSLKFLLWPFMKAQYETGEIVLTNFDTYFFNTRTFLYPFYHDLGLVGCIIYPGLISLALTILRNSTSRVPSNNILLMGLQKSILVTFFGNYFFGELTIFIPLFILGILSLIYRPPYSDLITQSNKSNKV